MELLQMNGNMIYGLIGGAGLFVLGIMLIVTSVNPQRNSVTRVLFRIWTFVPRVGSSMRDETWILLNGIGVLIGFLVYFLSLIHYHF